MNLLGEQDLPDIYVPTFEMKVENQKLDSSVAKNIMEISVTEYASGPSSFSFRLNDPKLAFIDTKIRFFGPRSERPKTFPWRSEKRIIHRGHAGRDQSGICGKAFKDAEDDCRGGLRIDRPLPSGWTCDR